MFGLSSFISNSNALKKHERLCNNHDYCQVEMPSNDNNILKYNHGEKSLKVPWVIYADFEYLPIKQQSCQNNPNDSYTKRKTLHEACGYSSALVKSFASKQHKHSFYRGKVCTKKFSKDFKEHATKIINFKEKDMIVLTDEEIEFYEKQNVCHI